MCTNRFYVFALSLFKPFNASLYHLITHGFFKALLFLSAGLLIHSFLLEQDIRKFGSFIFISPLFYIFFLIGSLAIIGMLPLSGFFSKDLILIHSLENNLFSYIILLIGSLLSSFYSYKILYFVFYNSIPNISSLLNYHSLSNYSFLFPFIFLLFGSLFLGYYTSFYFLSPETISLDIEYSIQNIFPTSSIYILSKIYSNIQIIPFLFPFITILLLTLFYNKFSYFSFLYPNLSKFSSFFNKKFLFDSLYNYFFVFPSFFLSYHITYKLLDRGYIEYLGPISLFRIFFYFPSNYKISNQYISNIPYLYFYFFITFIIIFFSYLFLFPNINI